MFVPDFESMAMENPGLILYNDKMMLQNDEDDMKWKIWTYATIIHELVHMWFGNYVTMKWWSDLWLNESFADYMWYKILYDTRIIDIDVFIYYEMRVFKAKHIDQQKNILPVIRDINIIWYTNYFFDNIVYSKGWYIINQFIRYIGDDIFFEM